MKFASKTATEPVYRNALYLTCAMMMKFNVAKLISQSVYGLIALEMISVLLMAVNVIQHILIFQHYVLLFYKNLIIL